jgi:dihydrofolate synthase/folylpolyglutamate synthase
MKAMTYEHATAFLFSRMQKGMKLGLETMQTLAKRTGHPQNRFTSIHIAGTNGKGSTAAILESILREAGYKTGLYTSPHLIDMRERIKVCGKTITREKVIEILTRLIPHIEATGASFFEILTAMAFLYFSEMEVDTAVLETGLGGRLDATNIVTPKMTIITGIGMEHTKILGKQLKPITREKAGIFKHGIPCISGVTNPRIAAYLKELAMERQVPIIFTKDHVTTSGVHLSRYGSRFNCRTSDSIYRDLNMKLPGKHQIENCSLALQAVETLRRDSYSIPEDAVRRGLENVQWRGRLDLLQEHPSILLDSAHNPIGIKRLVQAIKQLFEYDSLILIFGVLRDKDYSKMISTIAPLADRIIFTRPLSPRALEPEELMLLPAVQGKKIETIPQIQEAWNRAVDLAQRADIVCVAGSIYLVGEVLRIWGEMEG